MIARMYARVKFDREIISGHNAVLPGPRESYEMVFGFKRVNFDFYTFVGSLDEEDKSILEYEGIELDTETFPAAADITPDDVLNLREIVEYSVNTGDDGDPEIYESKLLELAFEFEDGTYIDCSEMSAVKGFIFDKVFIDRCYEAYKLDWMISHGYTLKDLSEILRGIAAEELAHKPMATTLPMRQSVDILADCIEETFSTESGFGSGSLYVCMDEFLGAEFRDEDYMIDLLSRRMDAEIMIAKWRNYTNTPSKPEVPKTGMLNISTANISKGTAEYLDQSVTEQMSGIVVYSKIGLPLEVIKDALPEEIDQESYGWFIYIPQDDRSDDLHELKDLPADLFECIKYADEHGCAWINFDPVYDSVGELPEYEWEDRKKETV